MLPSSFSPNQNSTFIFPNIICITAYGDCILLEVYLIFTLLSYQFKLLEMEGLSIAGTSDIMVTIEIKI